MDLPVHYEDRLVATISAESRATRLAYADAWRSSADSFPVSLAIPIRSEPYDGDQLLPWTKRSCRQSALDRAVQEGDGYGFDIASFELDGRERLIEVKTTNGWERTPFHISQNEIAVAETRRDC